MKFDKIKNDTNCKCIDNKLVIQNISDIFCRKVSEKVNISDFISCWEKNQRPKDIQNCSEVCKYKGLSFQKFTNEDKLIEYYRKIFKVSPMKKTKYYCKVKFKEDAGKIWCNSNKKVNPHHTFFKSDDFDIDIHM